MSKTRGKIAFIRKVHRYNLITYILLMCECIKGNTTGLFFLKSVNIFYEFFEIETC